MTCAVNTIDHINLRTPLLLESAAFYERLLGLTSGSVAGMNVERNRWMYDNAGRPIVHINLPDDGEIVPEGEHSGRLHHIAFDCVGYDAVNGRIADMGLEAAYNLVEAINLRQIFVFDPNDVRLELNFRGD